MILFISAWHQGIVVAVFLSLSAFLLSGGLLWLLSHAYKGAQSDIQDEQAAEQRTRDRKSQSAVKGWQTRRQRDADEREVEQILAEGDESERVLRQLDAQAEARGE